ncbi:TadE/TadG family type IV pilus assembly protein [Pseudarthrobacter sp. S3]|uniref:TadE/TadG family type IV pilus assembly protein n=1 Tax=Pseudarthrobacter sp. S3 TaxID=3418419 RepID=UPI003CE8B79D
MFIRLRKAGKPSSGKERGAVAVEAALIIPIFLVLVLGIFEFGRAFNIQVSLSEAARESARYAAVHGTTAGFTPDAAQAAGVAAAPSVALSPANVGISYKNPDGSAATKCGAGVNAISTVTFPTGFITGLDKLIKTDKPFTLTGRGVMRCGG